ncbi:serine hydrolase domain-containing protein [Aurantiacibacter sp. MUD61]|uniref:serine hydrolase domain-containing protein n=1 Tax=Aurantiacibacter sp. MUD61 TaxID=3009083 RepID=UPI0022F139BF|nr:serine hydrolase domain-containing protein [Aurantiacibacter sp. MUD61]
MMTPRICLAAASALALVACTTTPSTPLLAAPVPDQQLTGEAEAGLSRLRASDGIPAAGVAVIRCSSQASAVGGERRSDMPGAIASNGYFAIGSNAKSVLATAFARLADRGELSLEQTIGEIWPEAATAHPDKADITFAQLLGHASGLPAFDTGAELGQLPEMPADIPEASRAAAQWFLSQPLVSQPGSETRYSNAGYVIAGELLARHQGMPFAEVVAREVLAPLGIEGSYGRDQRLDAGDPVGHTAGEDGAEPYLDPEPPIPAWLQAAGGLSMPIDDYATYVRAHLCALQGEGAFLSQEMAERLHTPLIADGAALGWGRFELGGHITSFHIGGTGDFTAYMALQPDRDRAALAVVSVGGAPAGEAQSWLVEQMSAP